MLYRQAKIKVVSGVGKSSHLVDNYPYEMSGKNMRSH